MLIHWTNLACRIILFATIAWCAINNQTFDGFCGSAIVKPHFRMPRIRQAIVFGWLLRLIHCLIYMVFTQFYTSNLQMAFVHGASMYTRCQNDVVWLVIGVY